jgi:hypothetical protein
LSVRRTEKRTWLQCNGHDFRVYRGGEGGCVAPYAPPIEEALCQAFTEQLTLDEVDVAELARLAEQRIQVQGGQEGRLRHELAERKAVYQRAMELALREDNASLAEDLLERARQVKHAIAEREAELATLAAAQPLSPRAWILAQRAAALCERIRATFAEWSRPVKARVLALALECAVLGYVDRHVISTSRGPSKNVLVKP